MVSETHIPYGAFRLLLPWAPEVHSIEPFSSLYRRRNREGRLIAEVRKKLGSKLWTWEILYPGSAGHERRGTRAMKTTDSILVYLGYSLVPERLVVMA